MNRPAQMPRMIAGTLCGLSAIADMENGGLDMAKYRKKPVEVEAVQWTGKNLKQIADFLGRWPFPRKYVPSQIAIERLEGTMHASVGDYIIKGVNGEFYPCKPDIFEKTYERVEE